MRILLTGAAAGIMQGVAAALASDGHDLTITFRPGGTPPDATLRNIERTGVTAAAEPVDFLANEADVERRLREIVQTAGGFDALVHGVGPMTVKRFERSTLEDYHAMVDGNFRSAVQSAAAVLPAMRSAGFGRLIFFGLNGSHVTAAARGLALHAAAKSAVIAFVRGLALEEARYGISVNAIEPGDIREKTLTRAEARERTAGNPTGHPGTWEDVAAAVRFLLAPENTFVNGSIIGVNGGLTEPYERNATPR
jgi:3-oxoacyl-[acyl-carrier protein] reductase